METVTGSSLLTPHAQLLLETLSEGVGENGSFHLITRERLIAPLLTGSIPAWQTTHHRRRNYCSRILLFMFRPVPPE